MMMKQAFEAPTTYSVTVDVSRELIRSGERAFKMLMARR
jgi:hypothetical protein